MGYLKRIIYNCKKATLLIEKKELGRISLREQFELRIHLVGCEFCRIYKKQSRAINVMVRELFNQATKENHLSEEFKKELQERIDKH